MATVTAERVCADCEFATPSDGDLCDDCARWQRGDRPIHKLAALRLTAAMVANARADIRHAARTDGAGRRHLKGEANATCLDHEPWQCAAVFLRRAQAWGKGRDIDADEIARDLMSIR